MNQNDVFIYVFKIFSKNCQAFLWSNNWIIRWMFVGIWLIIDNEFLAIWKSLSGQHTQHTSVYNWWLRWCWSPLHKSLSKSAADWSSGYGKVPSRDKQCSNGSVSSDDEHKNHLPKQQCSSLFERTLLSNAASSAASVKFSRDARKTLVPSGKFYLL